MTGNGYAFRKQFDFKGVILLKKKVFLYKNFKT